MAPDTSKGWSMGAASTTTNCGEIERLRGLLEQARLREREAYDRGYRDGRIDGAAGREGEK
jgi:hypothetical protein